MVDFIERWRRRGMVTVQVALSLTALLAVLAIVCDGGMLLALRRHAQASADAAAMAAADDLLANYNTNKGSDRGGTAAASAQSVAAANGCSTSNVIVRTSGSNYYSGPVAGTAVPAGYAEVNVTLYQTPIFSAIFHSGSIPISARAVARGRMYSATSPAVLILDPSGSGVLSVSGGGNSGGLTASNGSVVVNSTSISAINTSGSHATVTAGAFQLTAPGYSAQLVTTPTANQITTGAYPTADPLRYLPAPAEPATGHWVKSGNSTYIYPGAYTQGAGDKTSDLTQISTSTVYFVQANAGDGNVIYIVSGGFNTNNTTYQMDPNTSGGIMIYNAGTSGLSLGGNSSSVFNLTAPTSGIYQGIAYFQARSSQGGISLSGDGSINISGTVYAPNAAMSLGGNGSTVVGSQLIVDSLSMNGNGSATVNYSAGSSGQLRQLQLVQ
jgi:Flp pilus assembly protein TadG